MNRRATGADDGFHQIRDPDVRHRRYVHRLSQERAAGPRTPFTQTLHELGCDVAASYVCGNGEPVAEVSAPRAPESGSESDPRAVTEALSLGARRSTRG